MRTRETVTVSLPPVMLKELKKVSKAEARTHSELVREALRNYFYSRFPAVTATKAELAAIQRGRAEIKAGKFVTLDQLLRDLDSTNRKTRRKKP